MTNVGHFLSTSPILDVIDHSRDVIFAHIIPCVVPELQHVHVGISMFMLTAVCVATRVSKPDIIASAGSDKGRSNFSLIGDPAECRGEKTVLHKYGRLVGTLWHRLLTAEAWNTIDGENIAILGRDLVRLKFKAVLRADLFETKQCITAITIVVEVLL